MAQTVELKALDGFMRKELPRAIIGRAPDFFITQPELSQVMRWKLLRGKFRPKLQAYVDSLSSVTVVSASRAAFKFASTGKIKEALDAMSKPLVGVGPATASAVLAAFDPSIPFMSDEALALLGGTPMYSLAEGVELASALWTIAGRLQDLEPPTSSRKWTAQAVQEAVWAAKRNPGGPNLSSVCSRLLASSSRATITSHAVSTANVLLVSATADEGSGTGKVELHSQVAGKRSRDKDDRASSRVVRGTHKLPR